MKLFTCPSNGEAGKILGEAYAGADWRSTWSAAIALVDEVISDNFEACETVYLAE
jgi:hypothetical protein